MPLIQGHSQSHLPGRAPLLGLAMFGAFLALTVGVAARQGAIEPAGAAVAAALYLALIALFGSALARQHPGRGLGAANAITLLRAALIILLAALIGSPAGLERAGNGVAALALFAIALDGVDGWVARRSGLVSDLGARFDMEVDALAVLVLGTLIVQQGRVGAWAILPGLLRYLYLLAAWPLPWLKQPPPASDLRRWICAGLSIALALATSPSLPADAAEALVGSSLAAVLFSFGRDVVWLYRLKDRR